MGITIDDDKFYELTVEGASVSIDVENRKVICEGQEFPFTLDPIEEQLLAGGGLVKVYEQFGPSLFQRLQKLTIKSTEETSGNGGGKLEW